MPIYVAFDFDVAAGSTNELPDICFACTGLMLALLVPAARRSLSFTVFLAMGCPYVGVGIGIYPGLPPAALGIGIEHFSDHPAKLEVWRAAGKARK